jgi:[protein-PII] uridylyltransferase
VLLLRAAAEAAERGIVLSPVTAGKVARQSKPLSNPWPDEARHQFVRLLGAGRGLLHVWETLEETGALGQFLPEWEEIRLLPHATTVHQYTVDRHSIETTVNAASLIREVARPDVLLVTALLHDIGKGVTGDHSIAGAPIARAAAARMGFGPIEVELIEGLVRYHLLLATLATTRDPNDPATIEQLLSVITKAETLELLLQLTEADARATGPKAWTTWRAALIRELAANARLRLDTGEPVRPEPPHLPVPKDVLKKGATLFAVEVTEDGARLTVMAKDRVGLMADVAAVLALQRVGVRACRLWSQDDIGVSQWDVADETVQAKVLQTRFEALVVGEIDADARLRPSETVAQLAPSVVVRPGAATDATVLEFRAADRPGTVYVVAKALAGLGITVRSAHLSTLGPQAVDVFYLQEPGAGALSRERAQAAVDAVRAVLAGE